MQYSLVLRRLEAYRKKHSLLQKNIAESLDITQSEYSKLELGKIKLSYEILSKLYWQGWDIDMVITGECGEPILKSVEKIATQKDEKQFVSALKLCEWAMEQWSQEENREEPIGNKLLKIFINDDSNMTPLEKLRKAFGVSQIQMAEIIGVNIKKYRMLEKGKVQLDAELMANIYEATGCKPSYFVDENTFYLSVISDECRYGDNRENQIKELLEIKEKFKRSNEDKR